MNSSCGAGCGNGDSAGFTVVVNGGSGTGPVTAITLTGGGESYTNGTYTTNFKTTTATGGTGGAVSFTASGGVIVSATLTAGGSGYTQPQLYQCQPNGTWNTSAGTAAYTNLNFKDLAEHKNGENIIRKGNVLRYGFAGGQYEVFNNSNESNDSGPGSANDNIVTQNNAIFDSYVLFTRSSRCG